MGFSETTRKIFNDDFFIYWFIGFTEGDGSFIINKDGTLEFKVTQSSADAQVLFYIKKQLGFGSVSVQDKFNKTHHFRVRKEQGLFTIINIFNGNLYLEKTYNRFIFFVNAFNLKYNQNICCFPRLSIRNFKFENAWLCGFADAEGCFNITIVRRSLKYTQIQVRFILSQKGEYVFMNDLAFLLKGKLSYLKSYDGYNLTVNLLNLKNIISYFNKYQLRTKKYINYFNWLKVYSLVISKKHLTSFGLNYIFLIVKRINKNFKYN